MASTTKRPRTAAAFSSSSAYACASTNSDHSPASFCGVFERLPGALLPSIFNRMPVLDRLLTLPRVCKAWRRFLQDEAACWQVVHLDTLLHSLFRYYKRKNRQGSWPYGLSKCAEMLCQVVLERSRGCLRQLKLPSFCNDALLSTLADRPEDWQGIRVLQMPYSLQVTEECLRKVAPCLRHLTHLDISGCRLSTTETLEAFGKNCPSITKLEVSQKAGLSEDVLSFAIARHFVRLKHLVLASDSLTSEGLQCILDSCTNLESLHLCDPCYLRLGLCGRRVPKFFPPHIKLSGYVLTLQQEVDL